MVFLSCLVHRGSSSDWYPQWHSTGSWVCSSSHLKGRINTSLGLLWFHLWLADKTFEGLGGGWVIKDGCTGKCRAQCLELHAPTDGRIKKKKRRESDKICFKAHHKSFLLFDLKHFVIRTLFHVPRTFVVICQASVNQVWARREWEWRGKKVNLEHFSVLTWH